jgi:hypothetical protein
MNRSIVIVGVALGAIVLLVGILLRSGNEPNDDEVPSRHEARAASARDTGVSGARSSDAEPPSSQRRSGSSRGATSEPGMPAVEGEGRSAARRGGTGDTRSAADMIRSRNASRDTGGVDGGFGQSDRRAGGLQKDDSNFRAAADNLPHGDSDQGRSGDHNDEAVEDSPEDVAQEPQSTPVVDDAMTYNSGALRFSIDSAFSIPNTNETGTVSLWVEPAWDADNKDDAAMIELGDGLFRVYKNVDVLRFEVMSDSPEHSTSLSIAEWRPGDAHSISATWGNQQVTFYVDGEPVGKPIPGSFAVQGDTPVTIGSVASPEETAPGTFSDVSVRGRPLSAQDISRLYNRSMAPKRSP